MKKVSFYLAVALVLGLSVYILPGNTQPSSNPRGAEIFYQNCSGCHPHGGNTITPNLPLRGAPQLASFHSFLEYLRRPTMPDGSPGPMPSFSERQISEDQAKELYQYLSQGEAAGGPGPGRGYGMRPGYGMGPGMMGRGWGYGMGPWMRGPGYGYQQAPKPLDEKEAKQMVENYLRFIRNPNLKVGAIVDQGPNFEVDLVTKSNSLVDKILVDKYTGWIRSAY
jgi:mono/diheme cytochrome c family protein